VRHPLHIDFINALTQLAGARESFGKLAEAKLILGNDNHIGDIGEYWVRRYYELRGQFKSYGTGKNCPYDLKLNDGTGVSVKTLTAWSVTGYGTPIRPLDGKHWKMLAAVFLEKNLLPEKLAIVPLTKLVEQPVFIKNAARRSNATDPTTSYPRFEWWPWLDQYKVSFTIKYNDLELYPAVPNGAEDRQP
jgi:hypothetical protein